MQKCYHTHSCRIYVHPDEVYYFNFQEGNWKTFGLFRVPISVERMKNILGMEWNAMQSS